VIKKARKSNKERKAVKHDSDISSAQIIVNFLRENNNYIKLRGKNIPNPNSSEFFNIVYDKYVTKKYTLDKPSHPKTIPDNMVDTVLRYMYDYEEGMLDESKRIHRDSMAAENFIGNLLERYLDTVLSNYGWVWCCGEMVKSVDFIKPSSSGYTLLQVKNRDNSENSSSKAIRDGTTILHWFRTYSKKYGDNWVNFPDINVVQLLSEEGFRNFVIDYSKKL
jgi:hypothetical protein